LVVLAVSVALNLALGVIALSRPGGTTAVILDTTSVSRTGWYAVFLTGNESFVGHITNLSSSDVTVQDVYFLGIPRGANLNPSPTPSPITPTICKLGTSGCQQLSNLYLPKDIIHIQRQNIAYFTELSSDSPVVKAIVDYEKKNPPATPKP
jgi:hypothetical protein